MGKNSNKNKARPRKAQPTQLISPDPETPPSRRSPWQNFWKVLGCVAILVSIFSVVTYVDPINQWFKSPKQKFHDQKTVEGDLNPSKLSYKMEEGPLNFKVDTFQIKRYPIIKGITIKDLDHQTLIMLVGRTAYMIDGHDFYRGINLFYKQAFCGNVKLVLGAKDDKLYVSAEFKDIEKEEVMGNIEFNHWKLYNENMLDFNNDDETLEVRDKQGNIAFAISYTRMIHMKGILISGYFIGDSSTLILRNNVQGKLDTQFCVPKTDPQWKLKVAEEMSKQQSYFNR